MRVCALALGDVLSLCLSLTCDSQTLSPFSLSIVDNGRVQEERMIVVQPQLHNDA